jgi:parvulin-like peptidyl-prolyl isomerase
MIVARVNSYEIEDKEYLQELTRLLKENEKSSPDMEIIELALDKLIDGALVLVRAKLENISVPEDEVQQEMIELQMKFKSPEEFESLLVCSGCTQEEIMERLRDKLMIRKYLESCVDNDFSVDEDYLKNFYDKNIELFRNERMVRVSHILISLDKGLDKARELRDKIETKEDFFNIAEKCSECPSCSHAGDLGFIVKGKMVKEFEDVAFRLEIDEISQPVRTEHGYHIIIVTDKRDAGTLSFEEVKEPLIKRLHQIDYELKLEKHLQELRKNADIFINREYIESLNEEGAE